MKITDGKINMVPNPDGTLVPMVRKHKAVYYDEQTQHAIKADPKDWRLPAPDGYVRRYFWIMEPARITQ